MGESRIKNKPSGGWTHILNSVAQDLRLSLDTRGLFLMMKSFPPDWEFNIPGLATMGSCGKDKVRRMLGELESAGYLLREQGHDETGKFSGNTYVLQDHPPLSEKADDGKPEKEAVVGKTDDGKTRQRENPSSENPTQTKEYKETKEESNIPPLPPMGDGKPKRNRRTSEAKESPDWKPERFQLFWDAYPRGESKQAAIKAWDKLKPDDALLVTMAKGLKKAMASEEWQRGIGIPHASTWLNQRRWTDEERYPVPPAVTEVQEVSYGWR